MVPQRTVYLQFRPMNVHAPAYVCIIYEKTNGKFHGERHVV